MTQELTPQQELNEFKARLISQVQMLNVDDLPEKHYKYGDRFHLRAALRLFKAASNIFDECGSKQIHELLNQGIINVIEVDNDITGEDAKRRLYGPINSDVFCLTRISNLIATANECTRH